MKKIFLLTIFIIASACGKKEVPEGMTRVIFKSGDDKSIQSFNLNKGLVVYGMNVDQGKSAAGWGSNIGNFITSNSEVILPNGRYKFFALGYDDNGTPGNDAFNTSSKVFCGEGNGGQESNLSGGVATVNIVLTDSSDGSNCAESFAGAEFRTNAPFTNSFKPLTITFCNSSGANNGGTCAVGTAVGINSAQIKVTSYDKIKNNMDFDFAKSIPGCIGVTAANLVLNRKIPYRIPFHFQIQTFDNAGCTGNILGTYNFPNGVEGAFNNPPFIGVSNTVSALNLYIKE